MQPDRGLSTQQFAGRKKDKARISVMITANVIDQNVRIFGLSEQQGILDALGMWISTLLAASSAGTIKFG